MSLRITDWPKAVRETVCPHTGAIIRHPAHMGAKPIRQSDIDRYGGAEKARAAIYGGSDD